jgi:adenosine deaminase
MSWFEDIPKVELHLHLEGAIPHRVLWDLIGEYGGDESVPDFESLEKRFEYKDFPHFIQTWSWKNQFLRKYEDFTFIAEQVALDLAGQSIRYAEVLFSPSLFIRHGLEIQRLTEAIRAGLAKVPDITIALVADLVRDYGPERETVTLSNLAEAKDLGVVGICIGGSEHEFPPQQFKELYDAARSLGFHTTAHAGEAAGPESIWGVIRGLHVDRIGHGTRAQEDDSLLDYLAMHRIPLEMCPLSNVKTGVVASLADHPVKRFFDRGILVTVNTDDPKMFGNSLAEEFRGLETTLGFSRDEIRTVILNGIEASWLSEQEKQRLTETFQKDPAWR